MPKQKNKTAPMTTRIDVALIQQIDQQARAAGLRRNDVVKRLIANGLQQSNKAPAKFAGVHVN